MWAELRSYLPASVLQVTHDLGQRLGGLLGIINTVIVEVDNVFPVLEDLLGGERSINRKTVPTCALPVGLAAPAAANLVQSTCRVGATVAAENEDKRSNVVRFEGLNHLLGHDGSGHGGTGAGGYSVNVDIILGTLERESARETKDAAFLVVC